MSRANTMNKAQFASFYRNIDGNRSKHRIYSDSSQTAYSRAFQKNQSRMLDHELSAQLALDDLSNYDPSRG